MNLIFLLVNAFTSAGSYLAAALIFHTGYDNADIHSLFIWLIGQFALLNYFLFFYGLLETPLAEMLSAILSGIVFGTLLLILAYDLVCLHMALHDDKAKRMGHG